MISKRLVEIYGRLFERFSYQYWWPADTQDEIIIGAVLTQNTAWNNVEKAIENLKNNNICSLESIFYADMNVLKNSIKPAGFFNQKSLYLKNIAEFFVKNSLFLKLSKLDTDILRKKLLDIRGIGKETADSILLYAFERPIFIVDAYTRRLIKRHNLSDKDSYDSVQALFMDNLRNDAAFFKEYHALIVKNAKEFCKTKPQCSGCPLEGV